jgi:hypothetical protein
MKLGPFRAMLVIISGILVTAVPGQAQSVHALFTLDSPAGGPFPTDRFTVPDPSQNTRRRVNLPQPDCSARPSDCEDLAVINTLDGFSVEPRLSIPFDGPIDVGTVASNSVFLIRLGSTLRDDDRDTRIIGINQIVWDVETNTLHAKSDECLDQHTRYALIVTSRVRDLGGEPIQAIEAFRRFRDHVRGHYRKSLVEAIRAARRAGIPERDIASASVFTTLSVTSILEKIRDQIKAAAPDPAEFQLGPDGSRTVFSLNDVTGITFNQQTGANPPSFTRATLNPGLLRIIPGAVGQIAFGKYLSSDYEVHPGEFIPPVGTRDGVPEVQGTNEIFFDLVLPSGTKPAGGWPVAIFGHGNGANDKNLSFVVAATLASHGIATIAINAVGFGYGPLGTLTVSRTGGDSVTFGAGGRGIDQDGNHVIDSNEGLSTAPPRTILFFNDGIRQTVADLMQLVRVIEVGMDVDGDGIPDVDSTRISYVGHSFGSNVGTSFLGVEPDVQAGVLNASGSPLENRRLGGRAALGLLLQARIPSLINAPGITSQDGVPANAPYFNDNMPLRDGVPLRVSLTDGTSHDIQSPVINTVSGAMAIQETVENAEWVSDTGGPVSYAPYLRKNPLPGVPAKSVIYQFSNGDRSAQNPNTTAILRAGELADRTTFFLNDLAYAENHAVPKNPHPLIISILDPAVGAFARSEQEQIATFFASDGTVVIQPEPMRFFEVPVVLPLPEGLNYIP